MPLAPAAVRATGMRWPEAAMTFRDWLAGAPGSPLEIFGDAASAAFLVGGIWFLPAAIAWAGGAP
jgi:hypothetical protein